MTSRRMRTPVVLPVEAALSGCVLCNESGRLGRQTGVALTDGTVNTTSGTMTTVLCY